VTLLYVCSNVMYMIPQNGAHTPLTGGQRFVQSEVDL